MIRLARSFVAVALCAQLAHAVLYQSVLPRAGSHGYFSWYLPALTIAVVAALIVLPVAAGARGRHSFASLLPERRAGRGARDVCRLALASGLYFLVQESLERTAQAGSLQAASFGPVALLALVLALAAAATAVVALERTLVDLVVRLARARLPRLAPTRWARPRDTTSRPRPLTVHGGLRAPPLTA